MAYFTLTNLALKTLTKIHTELKQRPQHHIVCVLLIELLILHLRILVLSNFV